MKDFLTLHKKKLLLALGILVLITVLICSGIYMTPSTQNNQSNFAEPFENIRVGANSYKVHEDLDNPKLAAETMAKLNQTAKQLIYHLNSTYIDDIHGLDHVRPQYRNIVLTGIKSLTTNFKTANMEENIPERSGGDTSYVINKGDVFAMCLRDPKNGNKIEASGKMNELNFVLFHELAHLFTSSFGHDNLFWNNFKFILQEAIRAKLYSPTDYASNTSPYCGIMISYSPLFDAGLNEYHM